MTCATNSTGAAGWALMGFSTSDHCSSDVARAIGGRSGHVVQELDGTEVAPCGLLGRWRARHAVAKDLAGHVVCCRAAVVVAIRWDGRAQVTCGKSRGAVFVS